MAGAVFPGRRLNRVAELILPLAYLLVGLVWFWVWVFLMLLWWGFVSLHVSKGLKRSGNANGCFGLFCCVEGFCASYLGNCCRIEFRWMCCQLQMSTVAFQEVGKSVKCTENINACNVISG